MAKPTRRRLAQEIVRMLRAEPTRQADIMRSLAGYLIDTKQAGQQHLVMNDIARELLLSDGHLAADIQSAKPLGAELQQSLTAWLTSATGAKTVELQQRVTPELIGGVVVRTPSQEFDASVRHKLTQLAGGIS